ncbi:hypothetical protein [Pseudoalteromonas byunsanensis]|uniref:Uncharacterized protein n=1 Tax=Pseudoalteromonas byunsanensis TaxID=327939 RepID=A0A1S1N6F4_9GAMM|nr:hypothetical protein [Pseudoalteromonas byunsanensis]OHU93841.1 hypothetical protein BIW53_16435 [Pseudoalteromonas byunsanensis]
MINGDDLRLMRLKAGISQQAMSQKLECDRNLVRDPDPRQEDEVFVQQYVLPNYSRHCELVSESHHLQ